MRKSVWVLTLAMLLSASLVLYAAEKETSVVTYVVGQGERWQKLNQAFQSQIPIHRGEKYSRQL